MLTFFFLISNPHKYHIWLKRDYAAPVEKLINIFMTVNFCVIITYVNVFIINEIYQNFFNWDSLLAKLYSHYEAWSYKKNKHKKIKSYKKSV